MGGGGCCSSVNGERRRRGRVVRHGSAKPVTPVQFRASPPFERALSSGVERFLDAEQVVVGESLSPQGFQLCHYSLPFAGRVRAPARLGEIWRAYDRHAVATAAATPLGGRTVVVMRTIDQLLTIDEVAE